MSRRPHPRARAARTAHRLLTAALAAGSLAVGTLATTAGSATAEPAAVPAAPAAVAAAGPDQLGVNLAQTTGNFYGGATGTLYGFADDSNPGAALAAGHAARTTAQKPQGGCQHSNGDVFDTEGSALAAGSKQIIIYMQDIYCNFPYEQPGIADYQAKARAIAQAVKARPNASKYAFVPFNEPDQIWYSDFSAAGAQRFYADWKTIVNEIRSVIPGAKIIGPNEANYNPDRIRGLLTYAKANNVLPDIMSWHELNPGSLVNYRAHYADYRSIETQVGITPREINIDEYGNTRDLSVPGQLIQWMTMFEDTKVDADMAYWTYAGNLDDVASQTTQGNAGWWLQKWYADLTGQTVKVTPPSPNVGDTLQGLATVDTARKQATVLLGGTANAINVAVSGVNTQVFGSTVQVEVTRTSWAGYEGNQVAPQRVLSTTATVQNGAVSVALPAGNPMSAYRVQITPVEKNPALTVPWSASYEAENAQLTSAAAVQQNVLNPDYGGAMVYAQSGRYDVGGMNQANSAATFSVNVPAAGSYSLAVLYGTNLVPQQQALWVDGQYVRTIPMTATFSWLYKGRVELPLLSLTAGAHSISIRTSTPSGKLANSDATLDRIDLTRVTGPATTTYTARDARLTGSATVRTGTATAPAAAMLSGSNSARFFVSAPEPGYYDLSTVFSTTGAGGLKVSLNGRSLVTPTSTGTGSWSSNARVHLGIGVSELTVLGTGTNPVAVTSATLTRATAGDSSTQSVQAEATQLGGRAGVITDELASGGAYVGYTGTENGSNGTLTVARGPATGAGAYDLTLVYANNARAGVRTEGVNRQLSVSETGGAAAQVSKYRNSYAWNNFWTLSQPLSLTTASGAVVIGNPSAAGPNIDTIQLSKLLLSSSVAAATP